MSTLRIATRPEGVDGKCTKLWPKLDHAYVGSSGNTVTTFLSRDWRCIKREHCAIVAIYSANGQTRFGVLKLFVFAFVGTLQAVEFAPGNFPGAKVMLKPL